MAQTRKNRFKAIRLAFAIAVAALALQSNIAHTGPGSDTAVNSNRDMCSLPPFLNVAVTERPNIMILYDNSTSMALQAYSKEYNPAVHYYGLFNADTCYKYDASKSRFTKFPGFPEEVVEHTVGGNTYANDNPEILDKTHPLIARQHNRFSHFCVKDIDGDGTSEPEYSFSGNFLNWATMRRVDLLRRAFTFGAKPAGAGTRTAVEIEGEHDFTPCFEKSYSTPLRYANMPTAAGVGAGEFFVVPESHGRNVNARVGGNLPAEMGKITFGFSHSCRVNETHTAELKEGLFPKDVDYAQVELESILLLPPVPQVETAGAEDPLADIIDGLFNYVNRPEYYQSYHRTERPQLASLTSVMNDVSNFIVAAPADPDLALLGWTITATDGTPLDNAYPGQTLRVTMTIANNGGSHFVANAGSIIKLTIATDGGVNAGSPTIPPATSCLVPNINKGSTATVPCDFVVPAAWAPGDFPRGSFIGVFVNPNNTPTEAGILVNDARRPWHFVQDLPDLRLVALGAYALSDTKAMAEFLVINDGTQTGDFGVKFSFSTDDMLDGLDPVVTTNCTGVRGAAQGESIPYACELDLSSVPLCALGCPSANYFVFAEANPTRASFPAETTYGNNVASMSLTMGATGGNPELMLTNVFLPASVNVGGVLPLSFKIRNYGGLQSPERTVGLSVDGVLLATCLVPAVPASSVSAMLTCDAAIPDAWTPGTDVDVVLALDFLDSNAVDNKFASTIRLTIASGGCPMVSSCTYEVRIDFFGRHRTGLLWMFNAKELGRPAPANIGVTRFDHWDSSGLITAAKFAGVEANQGTRNDHVSQLEKDPPNAQGKLAFNLLNTIKYYQRAAGFFPGSSEDPYFFDPVAEKNGKEHPCRKNYVLLITDGLAYNDDDPLLADGVAGDLKGYYPDEEDPPTDDHPEVFPMSDAEVYTVKYVPKYPDATTMVGVNGTYHVDNVALYGNMIDQRSDLAGKQTIQTIVVHTFADAGTRTTNFERSVRLMRRTAINGSFIERDGIEGPTSEEEWTQRPDGRPDGYFPARENDDIGKVILDALSSILLRTASGTSVSVIASTARGEGAIYQSYFRPVTSESGVELNWLGYLQALWVDKYNNLREDSNQNGVLDMAQDKIICYKFNRVSKETFATLWVDANGDGTPDGQPDADCNATAGSQPPSIPLTRLNPIFEAGKLLHKKLPADRTIYTWAHGTSEATPSTWPLYFDTNAVDNCGPGAPCLKERLWPAGNLYHGSVTMSEMLVGWVRGEDQALDSFRNRTATIDGNLGTWKLGDIVYSTPTVVGSPEERYDLLYGGRQHGYNEYFTQTADRHRLVLIGANDGMLHAFYGGRFLDGGSTAGAVARFETRDGLSLGEELWSYVPGSLMPNLRLLADAAYGTDCHISYVDLKPKVTDVQVFFDQSGNPLPGHAAGWGTIVIGGMRLGCGKSEYSSYFILDITDPELPVLMAEFGEQSTSTTALNADGTVYGLSGLDFSSFYPIVMHVADDSFTRNLRAGGSSFEPGRWYMLAGAGPDTISYNSTKGGSGIYVFDLTVIGERQGLSTPIARPLADFAKVIDTYHNGTGWVPMPARTLVANGLTGDLDADFSVDVAYFVTHTDDNPTSTLPADARWKSGVWRLNTRPAGDLSDSADPHEWEVYHVFDTFGTAYQPQAAAPSLSRDSFGNIWLYFGTGRLMYKGTPTDKIDDFNYGSGGVEFMQSLYGIIDPCWNNPVSNLQVSGKTCPMLPMKPANLANVTDLVTEIDSTQAATISCSGTCSVCAGTCTFPELIADVASGTLPGAGNFFGWRRWLPNKEGNSWEMSFNKPAVAGGYALFTTYVPTIDDSGADAGCTISGTSYLYVLDYQTGVAPAEDVFGLGVTDTTSTATLPVSQVIGEAVPSPPAIFGKQVFVQGSNAQVNNIKTQAVFKLKPRIRSWQEN